MDFILWKHIKTRTYHPPDLWKIDRQFRRPNFNIFQIQQIGNKERKPTWVRSNQKKESKDSITLKQKIKKAVKKIDNAWVFKSTKYGSATWEEIRRDKTHTRMVLLFQKKKKNDWFFSSVFSDIFNNVEEAISFCYHKEPKINKGQWR